MSPDRLSRVFAALADPTRREIPLPAFVRTRSVTELAEPHDMSLPAISKHLRVLERSGLIERARDAQWRPVPPPGGARSRKRSTGWSSTAGFWEESFDRLESYLQELQAKQKEPHARPKKSGEKAARAEAQPYPGVQRAAPARVRGVDAAETPEALERAARFSRFPSARANSGRAAPGTPS
ncbi:MAG: metalloregulator ArsR/SmtB family transcription factor [Lacunisphaera sp.]